MDRFWKQLEVAPAAARTLATWKDLCGGDLDETLLTPTGGHATRVPGAYPGAPPMRVYRRSEREFAAVCDQNISPEIDLDAGDLVLYRVSYRVLRSRLAALLGFRTSTAPADDLPGCIRVGEFGLTASRRVPVWLMAHPDEHRLQTIVRETAQGSDDGAMIMTFTDAGWGDELNAWVRKRKCVMVPVSDVVEAGNGPGWRASSLWEVHQDALREVLGVKDAGSSRRKPAQKRRGFRLACIDALRKQLTAEAESRVQLIVECRRLNKPVVLPKFLKQDLAERAACSPSNVTNAFKDKDAKGLPQLFLLLSDEDGLLKWWEGRRRLSPALSKTS